jgi:hypothetical protein
MDLLETIQEYFQHEPVPDPSGDGFQLFTHTEGDVSLLVSVCEPEALISLTIMQEGRELPLFLALHRDVSEIVIKERSPDLKVLWFRCARNAVFVNKSPISIYVKS